MVIPGIYQPSKPEDWDEEKDGEWWNWKDGCEHFGAGRALIACCFSFLVWGILTSHFISMLVFVYVEKPSIDARKVFKNSLDKE